MNKKILQVSKITIMLAVFFALDKGLGILRQMLISRQMGFSAELDAFNVANNVPDLLFALISGGALAMAFIPVLTEILTVKGRQEAWDLFSRIANLAFIVTAVLAVVVALLAKPLVGWEMGIAPGFTSQHQDMVVRLMRMNLIATLIFSISGLVMAGLQSNQHFLLPAMAPLLYNVGQIFGVLVLSPEQGYSIGGITLPAFGMGIQGLVYGVIIGALLHLFIQIPALIKFGFRWKPVLDVRSEPVLKVLRLMAPRLATMFTVQLIFLVRDNLASRLEVGSVTALTYGWMIFQVPETLIGTAVGTALLPTLAEHIARDEREEYRRLIRLAVKILVGVTIPVALIMALILRPLIELAFGLPPETTDLLLWVTRGYLLGLTGQCLLEVAARSYYARQDAVTPFLAALVNLAIYLVLGFQLFRTLGAPGISVTDAVAFTVQAVLLLVLLDRLPGWWANRAGWVVIRLLGAVVVGGLVGWLISITGAPVFGAVAAGVAAAAGLFAWLARKRIFVHA